MEKKRIGQYFKYAFGEIILVVIGILIALQINNWNERNKVNESIQTTLQLLKDEIQDNKSNINNVQSYHVMVRDTLATLEKPKEDKDMRNSLRFWRGMQTPRMQKAAFQTSIQSGVSKEFNPLLLKNLNSLYTYQDSYNEFTKSASQIFFNTDFSDISNFNRIVTSIQMTMGDLYYYETELNNRFEESLAKIDSIYPQK